MSTTLVEEGPPLSEFGQRLSEFMRAGYQCLFIPTSEEARVLGEVRDVVRKLEWGGVCVWDAIQGFNHETLRNNDKYKVPLNALRALTDENLVRGNVTFCFLDLDDYFVDPAVRRQLRTLIENGQLVGKKFKRPLLIISAMRVIHPKLKPCMQLLDFQFPTWEQLNHIFDFVQASVETKKPGTSTTCDAALRELITNSLLGLSAIDAENALSRVLVRRGGFVPEVIPDILAEKASIVQKSEVLTYVPETAQAKATEIGGYDKLMDFIRRRSLAYHTDARAACLDYPKGIALIGPPGTGKSYVGMSLARMLGMPGYIMDVGAVFGHLVGESEQRMRDALRTIEAQQGCVLILDEVDKAFGGVMEGGGDSGVSKRVFGQLLTWMANKKDRTFVVMTLNRTKGIPLEFLRVGRLDRVFWTDLPNAGEREAIFRIHLRKRGVPDTDLMLSPEEVGEIVDKKTEKFVGGELEALVVEAKFLAFERRRARVPNFEEFCEAAAAVIPQAITDSEAIQSIREACQRYTPVSTEMPRSRRSGRTRSVNISGAGAAEAN